VKPKKRKIPLIEILVTLVVLAVIARAVYWIAHWRSAWEAVRGLSAMETALCLMIGPPFLWWYCRRN